ncbi:unnamed protein product, partial [Brassica rapa subsp. trilocularis]
TLNPIKQKEETFEVKRERLYSEEHARSNVRTKRDESSSYSNMRNLRESRIQVQVSLLSCSLVSLLLSSSSSYELRHVDEIPCVKPSSTDEKPATSPAKEVSVDVVEKTEVKASGSSDASPTKEAQMAVAIPVNAEEAKHVVDKTQLEAIGASATKEVPVARPITVTAEEAKYVVDKTQLEAIASSSEIREALKDESLQKLITKIDSSSNPLKELDEAMGEEAFRMLKDKIKFIRFTIIPENYLVLVPHIVIVDLDLYRISFK